jgi:beta-glucosidase/6-phospho-beta-glucosidase/beta-galactosidase
MADVNVSDGISDTEMQILDKLADQDAVSHYRDVFATLHENGLEPMVTLQHFTLPIWLHNPQKARITETLGTLFGYTPPTGGGWASDNTAVEFEKYAAYAAYEFGDQVDTWVTINEPVNVMLASYLVLPGQGGFPPGVLRGDLLKKSLINEAEANAAAYGEIHHFDVGPDTQVGVVLLTLTLCTGLFYMKNLFSVENIDKAVLSIIAWFVYIVLLWGHYHEGWRGRRVVWFNVAGAGILTLAYFGSRFIQQFAG